MRRLAALLLALPLATTADDDDRVFGPREATTRAWVAGQVNVILQANPSFHAAYSGKNSFGPNAEERTSLVATFYSTLSLARYTEAIVDVEMAAGGGLSQALGLAGYTNADVVRNPSLGGEPYLARAMFRQIVPLSSARVPGERGRLGLAAEVPRSRLELRLGKMSTVDFFDTSGAAGDSQRRFMNWALVNEAAYDYAADTRGYTWGLYAEYDRPPLTIRAGVMLMPKVANGLELEWEVLSARGQNFEVDVDWSILGNDGTVRLLAWANRAHMGRYREAIAATPPGGTPDVTATRTAGRVKVGGDVNVEQRLGRRVRAFARAGACDGSIESFAYTEAEDSFSLGLDVDGAAWRREGDWAGIAAVTNGLAAPHRDYLALGGLGFLLGDGALRYGREGILEAYYEARVVRGTFVGADVQLIRNPGYNRDRGPVVVGSLRAHLDL